MKDNLKKANTSPYLNSLLQLSPEIQDQFNFMKTIEC